MSHLPFLWEWNGLKEGFGGGWLAHSASLAYLQISKGASEFPCFQKCLTVRLPERGPLYKPFLLYHKIKLLDLQNQEDFWPCLRSWGWSASLCTLQSGNRVRQETVATVLYLIRVLIFWGFLCDLVLLLQILWTEVHLSHLEGLRKTQIAGSLPQCLIQHVSSEDRKLLFLADPRWCRCCHSGDCILGSPDGKPTIHSC